MIHVFISYGGKDRPFAEKLATTIKENFKDIIETRIIESEDNFEGDNWKQKVLTDLEKTSIFIIIISQNSIDRQWPNQELGYAFALKKHSGKILKIIPVIEVEEWEGRRAKYVELKGFITEDMDKVHYEPDNPDECISKIISKIEAMDLEKIERGLNPHLKQYTKEELRVLQYMVNHFYNNPTSFNLYVEVVSLSESLGIPPEIINDTLDNFVTNGILEQEYRDYYRLSLQGYWTYVPVFLDYDPQKDVDMIFLFISSQSGERQMVTGREIYEETYFNPFRINFSINILEDSGHVDLLRGMGSAPYHFSGVKLSPHGRHVLRKNEESK